MNGPEHLWTAGHSGHGLDEDFQVLLQTMDDLHGLVIFLTPWNQGLYNKTVLCSSYLFSGIQVKFWKKYFNKNFRKYKYKKTLSRAKYYLLALTIHNHIFFWFHTSNKFIKWHRPAADLYNCSLPSGRSPQPGLVSVPPGVASSPGWTCHIWSLERVGGTPPASRAHCKHFRNITDKTYFSLFTSSESNPGLYKTSLYHYNNSAEFFVISWLLWKRRCSDFVPFHMKTTIIIIIAVCIFFGSLYMYVYVYSFHILKYSYHKHTYTLYIQMGLSGRKKKHLTSISLSLGDRLQKKCTFQINGDMNMSSESCEVMLESD